MYGRIGIATGVLAAIGIAAASPRIGGQGGAQEPAWRKDYAAACAEARAQHKPLFVTFRCER